MFVHIGNCVCMCMFHRKRERQYSPIKPSYRASWRRRLLQTAHRWTRLDNSKKNRLAFLNNGNNSQSNRSGLFIRRHLYQHVITFVQEPNIYVRHCYVWKTYRCILYLGGKTLWSVSTKVHMTLVMITKPRGVHEMCPQNGAFKSSRYSYIRVNLSCSLRQAEFCISWLCDNSVSRTLFHHWLNINYSSVSA